MSVSVREREGERERGGGWGGAREREKEWLSVFERGRHEMCRAIRECWNVHICARAPRTGVRREGGGETSIEYVCVRLTERRCV